MNSTGIVISFFCVLLVQAEILPQWLSVTFPRYPAMLDRADIQGTFEFELRIRTGKVQSAKVVKYDLATKSGGKVVLDRYPEITERLRMVLASWRFEGETDHESRLVIELKKVEVEENEGWSRFTILEEARGIPQHLLIESRWSPTSVTVPE